MFGYCHMCMHVPRRMHMNKFIQHTTIYARGVIDMCMHGVLLEAKTSHTCKHAMHGPPLPCKCTYAYVLIHTHTHAPVVSFQPQTSLAAPPLHVHAFPAKVVSAHHEQLISPPQEGPNSLYSYAVPSLDHVLNRLVCVVNNTQMFLGQKHEYTSTCAAG